MSTGAQTPRESFKPEVSGYCSKVFGVPFPTRFDLPGTTAILADQGYGIYAVMFLFAIMGRLLFRWATVTTGSSCSTSWVRRRRARRRCSA